MAVDGRGSVRSVLPTHDPPTISSYPASVPGHPPARQRARHRPPSPRPGPPCLIVTPTHHPPAREIRGAILGPGSGGAPDGGPAAARESPGHQEAYRWGCGGTGVNGGGRVVIVVATGITCGMRRGPADAYLYVIAGEGGRWWVYAAGSSPRPPAERNLGMAEPLPDHHSPLRTRAGCMSAQHGREMLDLTGSRTIDNDDFYEAAIIAQMTILRNESSTWPSHHSWVAFVGGPSGDPAMHMPCSRPPQGLLACYASPSMPLRDTSDVYPVGTCTG